MYDDDDGDGGIILFQLPSIVTSTFMIDKELILHPSLLSTKAYIFQITVGCHDNFTCLQIYRGGFSVNNQKTIFFCHFANNSYFYHNISNPAFECQSNFANKPV